MSEINQFLQKGEKIIQEFSPHPMEYLGHYVFAALIAIFSVFLLIVPIIIYILIIEGIRRGNKYYITNKRVIHQYIFISKKTSSAMYDKLQDIHFSQSLVERIFGIGQVHLNTAGTHLVEIVFKGVKDPSNVKKLVETYMLKKKK